MSRGDRPLRDLHPQQSRGPRPPVIDGSIRWSRASLAAGSPRTDRSQGSRACPARRASSGTRSPRSTIAAAFPGIAWSTRRAESVLAAMAVRRQRCNASASSGSTCGSTSDSAFRSIDFDGGRGEWSPRMRDIQPFRPGLWTVAGQTNSVAGAGPFGTCPRNLPGGSVPAADLVFSDSALLLAVAGADPFGICPRDFLRAVDFEAARSSRRCGGERKVRNNPQPVDLSTFSGSVVGAGRVSNSPQFPDVKDVGGTCGFPRTLAAGWL